MGKVAIISLTPDFVAKDLVLKSFKVEQGSHKVSYDIPVVDGGSYKSLLLMVEQFEEMRKQAKSDDLRSFMDFKLCLKGPTLEDFRSYCPITVDDMKKAGSFDTTLKTWLKDACFPLDAFCRQKQWMVQELSKPYTMKVLDFANWL